MVIWPQKAQAPLFTLTFFVGSMAIWNQKPQTLLFMCNLRCVERERDLRLLLRGASRVAGAPRDERLGEVPATEGPSGGHDFLRSRTSLVVRLSLVWCGPLLCVLGLSLVWWGALLVAGRYNGVESEVQAFV